MVAPWWWPHGGCPNTVTLVVVAPWWPPPPWWPHGGPLQEERSAQATLAAWREYRHACELRLRLDPPAPGEWGWGRETRGTLGAP